MRADRHDTKDTSESPAKDKTKAPPEPPFSQVNTTLLSYFHLSIPPSILPFTHTFWVVLAQWFACVFVCDLQHSAVFSRLALRGTNVINPRCPHSSFQILAGDFSAWLRVPETQTCFATFVWVFPSACVTKDKCSAEEHSYNVWEALEKLSTFLWLLFLSFSQLTGVWRASRLFLLLPHSALMCLTFLTGKWERRWRTVSAGWAVHLHKKCAFHELKHKMFKLSLTLT